MKITRQEIFTIYNTLVHRENLLNDIIHVNEHPNVLNYYKEELQKTIDLQKKIKKLVEGNCHYELSNLSEPGEPT